MPVKRETEQTLGGIVLGIIRPLHSAVLCSALSLMLDWSTKLPLPISNIVDTALPLSLQKHGYSTIAEQGSDVATHSR